MAAPQGPLSPHLLIYKPQLTSLLSIIHRATGVFLSIGALLFCAWLTSLAMGPNVYSAVSGYIRHPAGQFILLLFIFSLNYHLCNGIRHLFWDMGKATYLTGYIVVVASIILTAATWMAGVL